MQKQMRLMRLLTTLAVALLLVGLAWQCMDIYIDGNAAGNLDEKGLHIQQVYRAEDIGLRLRKLAPMALVCFLLAVSGAILEAKHPHREEGKQGAVSGSAKPPVEASRVHFLRISLFAAAAVLIGLGVRNGGMRDVLIKAINICTECIGLG